MAPIPMTLNDIEGHFRCLKLLPYFGQCSMIIYGMFTH